jgi:hypothetical protein
MGMRFNEGGVVRFSFVVAAESAILIPLIKNTRYISSFLGTRPSRRGELCLLLIMVAIH